MKNDDEPIISSLNPFIVMMILLIVVAAMVVVMSLWIIAGYSDNEIFNYPEFYQSKYNVW